MDNNSLDEIIRQLPDANGKVPPKDDPRIVDYSKQLKTNTQNSVQKQGGFEVKLAPFNPLPVSGDKTYLSEFNVPIDAIYDKLNNGKYVAKFENYKGAVGNEDRLAKEQSAGEQFLYGLTKNVRKAGNFALDQTFGTLYGIGQAVQEGKWKGLWDNDISRTLDDWNKQLDYKLPNYYTDEQKSMSWLRSMGTMNFWANDVANGLAFVGGTILSGAAMSLLTGGASAAGGLAKLGFKLGAKGALNYTDDVAKLIGKSTDDIIKQQARYAIESEKGRLLLRGLTKASTFKGYGTALDTGAFLVRSSMFEAGMEARHNFREATDKYILNFEDKNGRPPTSEELQKFLKQAESAANSVFGMNLVVLAVSNAAMYGKALGISDSFGAGVNNSFNKLIGLGVRTDLNTGRLIMQQATRPQKVLGKAYKLLGKSLISEGLFEEGLQGVAGTTMQNYLETKYDPKANDADSMFNYMGEAFKDQYTSNEGWKEIVIGGIIGMVGGTLQIQRKDGGLTTGGIQGFGQNSYRAAQERITAGVAEANKAADSVSESLNKRPFSSLMADASFAKRSKEDVTNPNIENFDTHLNYIRANEQFFSPSELESNFETIVNNTELTQSQKTELERAGITEAEYKAKQISDFQSYSKSYGVARRAAEALILPNVTDGNKQVVADAYIRNVMLGEEAIQHANQRLKKIAEKTNIDGGAIHFYNNLEEDKKQLVEEHDSIQNEIDEISKAFLKLSTAQDIETKGEATATERNTKAEQRVALQQRLDEKLARKEAIENILSQDLKINQESLNQVSELQNSFTTVQSALDSLKAYDNYVANLRSVGRTEEAEALEQDLYEYKMYSDMHREFIREHRAMLSTNFFSSEKGKGLLGKLIGPSFSLSPETLEMIEQNNDSFDKAINDVLATKGAMTRAEMVELSVAEKVRQMLEGNTEISEREKFRLEALIRLTLTTYKPYVSSTTLTERMVKPTQKENPLEGDTISITRKPVPEKEQTTIQAIEAQIQDITSQLETFLNLNSPAKKQRIQDLENQLATLQEELASLKSDTVVQNTVSEEDVIAQLEAEYDLFHTGDSNLTIEDVSVEPRVSRQGRKGKYGGFYTYGDLSRIFGFQKGNNTKSIFGIKLKKGVKIQEYSQSIERLSKDKLDELRSLGYQVIKGKSLLGVEEVVVIDKSAIESVTNIDSRLQVAEQQNTDVNTAITAQIEDVLTSNQRDNLDKARNGEKAPPATKLFDSLSDLISKSKTLLGKTFNVGGLNVQFVDYKGEVLTGAGQRVFVKVIINGVPVTFYSSTGSGKKALQEGVFYPTLGIESDERFNGTWINKIDGVEMASYYNSPQLALVGAFIDAQFGNTNSFAGEINQITLDVQNPNKTPLTKDSALDIRREYNKEYLNSGRETFSNNERTKVVEAFNSLVSELNNSVNRETTQPEAVYENVNEQALAQMKRDLEEEENSPRRSQEIVDQLQGGIILLEEKIARETAEDAEPFVEEDAAEVQRVFEFEISQIEEPTGVTLYGEMTDAMDVTLTRVKSGKPVSAEALKEVGDYLYKVYKNILSLKKTANTEAQTSLGLTLAYLEQEQATLEQELTFLADYETAYTTGEDLPIFIFSPTGKTYENASRTETTVDEQTEQRDSQVEKSITKTRENATKNNQQQEQENPEQGGLSQYTGVDEGQQAQEETTQPETNPSDSSIRSEEIQKEINVIEEKLRKEKELIKIMETEDYVRMEELLGVENRTPEQEDELRSLKDDFDTWMLATGIISKGVRLSDLIEQKVALEKAEIRKTEFTVEPVAEEVATIAESNDSRKGKIYYENTQTHDAVTIDTRLEDNSIRLSGLRAEDIPSIFTETINGEIIPIVFEFEVDPQNGNILIPRDELKKFDTPESNVMLRPGSPGITQNYSILYANQVNEKGEQSWSPVKSTFTDYNNPQDIPAIYNLEVGDDLTLFIDTRDEFNANLIAAYNKVKGKVGSKAEKEARENLIKNLRINTYKGKSNLSDLKAITPSDITSDNDEIFASLRRQVIEDNLEKITDKGAVVNTSVKIKTKKILPGHPTFNVEKRGSQYVVVPKAITKKQTEKIVDLGVRKGDETFQTRAGKGDSKIDTTYLPKNGKDIAFVVIEVGNKKIAYPVKLMSQDQVDLEAFRKIYNETQNPTKKAILLNEFLANSGLDIKKKGNAFYSFGKENNLDESTFENMVSKLEKIEYLYPLKNWLDTKIPIEEAAQNATVNLDLNKPFHSPKIEFDLGQFNKKAPTSPEETATKTTKAKEKTVGVKGFAADALNAVIENNKNENC